MLVDDIDCRACGSGYMIHTQDVLGRRSRATFPQYFCMDCRSFQQTSGYRESDDQMRVDFEALFAERQNHEAISGQLFLELITRKPHVTSMLEIGHGTGFLMKAAVNFGRTAKGFEVNPYCVEFARNELGLDSVHGMWDDSFPETYDLIAANQVFEHLEDPLALFRLMTRRLNPDGCIYIAVPVVERMHWPYLRTAGTTPGAAPPDPFYDNDVHITHFSVDGLRRLGLRAGAREADYFISQDTFWKSPGAYHGVLFSF